MVGLGSRHRKSPGLVADGNFVQNGWKSGLFKRKDVSRPDEISWGESMSQRAGFFSGERWLSRDDFESRVLRAGSVFSALGVGSGDAVALLLRNDFCFFEATYGANLVGAYAVPINWHSTAGELAYLLEDSRPRVLVGHADLLVGVSVALSEGKRWGMEILVVDTSSELATAYGLAKAVCVAHGSGRQAWNVLIDGAGELPDRRSEVIQSMFYTSGTTGSPKGVRRLAQSKPDVEGLGRIRDRVFGLSPGISALVPGPLYHSAPNSMALRAAQQAKTMVLMPRFDAEESLRLIQKYKITNIFLVPTMLIRLLKLPSSIRAEYDVTSLQYIMIAAAPCPAQVKREIIEWWGPIVHEFYGSTELGYMTICDSAEALSKPGTVGRAIEGARVKALDSDGHEVPVGEPGEIFGRLAGFPDFTYNNRDKERAEIERDGLITCGDMGYFDTDGYLFLCDRVRDMVISGGVNIYPAEIETSLVGMPGVADCAVFGIPHDEYGEQLLAVVQCIPGYSLKSDDIKTYLRERIAGYKVPRRIEFEQELPREDSGKIFKRRLRDRYWKNEPRQI